MLEDFEAAVAQHKDMVYSFAYYYLGNRQEAEDVTQDVLLKLWEHRDRLSNDAAAPWLNRVTRNTSYDLLRRKRTKNRFVVDDGEEAMTLFAEEKRPGPHRLAEQTDVQVQVQRALHQLPEPYRSAMILRELQELTYAQVSDALEIPVNTAKTHVHRGRKMLRETLRRARS